MRFIGTFVASEAPKLATNEQDYNDIIPTLPKEFDARQRWGPCVHPIRYVCVSACGQALKPYI